MASERFYARLLYPPDSHQMHALLAQTLSGALFTCPMDDAEIQANCFQPEPSSLHSVRWLRHQIFGVLAEERLLGFIDVGLGYDHATQHLMDDRPLGLLRFLVVPTDYNFSSRVARLLLQTAETFWREQSVRRVRAFSFSTGYPAYQMGAGILPSTWEDHQRWLNQAGYRPTERYYCLAYPLNRLGREDVPVGSYTLYPENDETGLRYQIYEDDEMRIAATRMIERQVVNPKDANPVAGLVELIVASAWRRKGIGRWLLRRMINDAHQRGNHTLVTFVAHANRAGLGLCRQAGFEEINYRGYTLEKQL
ncbi:MAG: GNAT family N-acetyltransferase [Caldilineaceae bacterium]|nr:GNAT family N-acetyltransferase [Caldilineaceae bacterium]